MLKAKLRKLLASDGAYRFLLALTTFTPPTRISGSRDWLQRLSPKPVAPTGSHTYQHTNPDLEISFIVPVYNMGAYIGACLDSILCQQTEASFEVIVINDGSTDHSLELIRARMAADPRIVLIDQGNKGYSGARNIAIDQIRGKKLCFVDADDMIAPDHLNNLLNHFNANTCDFVTGRFTYVDQAGVAIRASANPRNHGAPWGRLYDRKVWADLRFPEGYWFEDTIQGFCIESRYVEFKASDELGYFYRIHPDSQCGKSPHTYKSIDSYWILEDLLPLCRELGIPLSQNLYDRTIMQLGPLLRGRTNALKKQERKALFSSCCDLIANTPEFDSLCTSLPGRWRDLEWALRKRNYHRWILACRHLG
ncbi:MAG: glycosyltransferase family 2 protein [Cyanobium sp.]